MTLQLITSLKITNLQFSLRVQLVAGKTYFTKFNIQIQGGWEVIENITLKKTESIKRKMASSFQAN